MASINREALLKATKGLLSSSESDDSSSDERGRSRSPSRKRSRSEKRSKPSKKQKRQKEQHKKHHKRSEQEKIRELERKAHAIGATSILGRFPGGLGSLSTAAGPTAGDAVVLDTVGDANNSMFESLYAASVPRYHRVDPMNLVSTAKYSWQAQVQQADKDAGNTRANRYYKGRNLLLERSRQTRRLHLADLRPKHHTASQLQQQHQQGFLPSSSSLNSSSWMSLLAGLPQQLSAIGFAPKGLAAQPAVSTDTAGTATAEVPSEPGTSSSSRRLVIPAPAFIPLEPPEELVKAADGSGDAEGAHTGVPAAYRAGFGVAGAANKIDPEVLVQEAGLTADEWVLKATRAWNIAVRERPQDEQLWLDFAAFQHVAARLLQQQRSRDAADTATAEKQISVLTRGLSHHPHSDRLLLALLRSYAVIAPDAEALDSKWRGVLARQPGSWMLWLEYLAIKNSNFATFSVSTLQASYIEAIHALHMELLTTRRKAAAAYKQQHGPQLPQVTPDQLQQLSPAAAAAAVSGSSSVGVAALLPVCVRELELELQMVQLLLGLMYQEMVAGHTEQVIAKIQALLEYHLFQPPTPPGGPAALLRLFAAFWESGAPRIGETGSRGWAYWCCWHAMGMEQPTAVDADDAQQQQQEEEPAGWSGWFEVPQQQQQEAAEQQQPEQEQSEPRIGPEKPKRKRKRHSDSGDSESGSDEYESELSDSEAGISDDGQASEPEPEPEVDEVDLMLQLGIQLEEQLQEMEKEGLPPHIVKRWCQEEANRCSSQWQPLNPKQQQQQQQESAESPPEAPDPCRIIQFDAVEPCLFPIRSLSALKRLVLGSLELLGAPLGPWCSSNSPTPLQQLSPEVPECSAAGVTSGPRSVAGSLGGTSGTSGGTRSQWSDATADVLAGSEVTQLAAAAAGAAGAEGAQLWQQQQQQDQLPWYQASDERWEFVIRVLGRLVTGGPGGTWPDLCSALLLLHASKPSDTAAAAAAGSTEQLITLTVDGAAAAAAGVPGSSSSNAWPSQQQLGAARAAAKQLLSDQRDNLLLYDAYGCCEAAMGQTKTARKVLSSALVLATSTAASSSSSTTVAAADPAAAAAAVPVLAVHLAQLEFAAGGKGSLERAHAAVHACLAGEIYQPAAAGHGSVQQQQQQQGLLAESALIKARRGFQDRIKHLLTSDGGSLTPAAAATVAGAALFELTVGIQIKQAAKGIPAAAAVYKQVLAAVPEPIRAASAQHEQLQVLYCHMLVAAAVGAPDQLVPPPPAAAAVTAGSSSSSGLSTLAAAVMAAVSPARARSALATALMLYPSSKALLNLQVWLDHSCYTLAGLRRQLAALSELNPSPRLWGTALQAEALRPGGRVRLRALFERALAAPTPAHWQQQQHVQWQQQSQALAAAGLKQQQQKDPAKQQELEQQRQLQDCNAADMSVVLLNLAVQDGYRGWGNCSALWQQYIQYELSLGRPENARKLFLRAVHECPGFKGLWLSGFGALFEGMQPRETSGLMTAMQEREVLTRTDVYEVLLADMAEKQQ